MVTPDSAKSCFVIGPLGKRRSSVRRRADALLAKLIRPAVEPLGYKVERPEMAGVIDIMPAVIRHVLEDDLVVADLTGGNPNVFYELAIRHVRGKALVQLINEGNEIPFDLQGTNVIEVNLDDDQDVKSVQALIRDNVRAMEAKGGIISSPIRTITELLLTIPALIWPERVGGPSPTDWKTLVDEAEKIKNATAPDLRDAHIKGLYEVLKTFKRVYGNPRLRSGTRVS
ncbi:MAG: hypothetical protein ACYSWQ_14785 [Planctomycetota bacterium]|jgi:hypothetical protein